MINANTQSIPQITITKLRVGEFEVSVPPGLNELLNVGGAWGINKKEVPTITKQYDSRTEKRNGKLVTVLTKKII